MPIRHTAEGWFWGSKGPFESEAKARQVERAAYANGYRGGARRRSTETGKRKRRFRG